MPRVWILPAPDATLAALEADPGRSLLLDGVNRVLDQLEVDPADDRVRRIRFQNPPLWCVRVFAGGEEWVVLWRPHATEPDVAVVQYIGPASFA